ncbi:MAG TPA: hypothetical protein VHZ54_10795, partial [Solirubrobacterales bacterium]|nr:hypothetical protein [Solirubrobacterales bacterium]
MTDLRAISIKALFVLALSLGFGAALATWAKADEVVPTAVPKILGMTAPTHLPTTQSEVQRVTVEEAEGGDFTLATKSEVKATPVVAGGDLTFTAGSTVARIEAIQAGAEFGIGDRVSFAGSYESGIERLVVACSTDCKTLGSTVTFSEAASEDRTDAAVEIFTKELTVTEGEFAVGEEIARAFSFETSEFPFFAPGTTVTAFGGGTMTLSAPTTFEYLTSEGTLRLLAEKASAPIASDSSSQGVQNALEGLLGAGAVTVTGDGGGVENPYFVEFRGSLADKNVPLLLADGGGLTGEHALIHVFTTVPGGPGTGEIVALPSNIGPLDTTGPVTVTIGPLPTGIVFSGPVEDSFDPDSGLEWSCTGGVGDETVSCTVSHGTLPALHNIPRPVHVPIEVISSVAPGAVAPVEISGGGSSRVDRYLTPIVVSNEPPPFGLSAEWGGSFEADGSPSLQAGGHPFVSAAYFMANTIRNATGAISPVGDPKDEIFDLPPGFIGNPLASKRCPQSTIVEPNVEQGSSAICNEEMTVGNLDPFLGFLHSSLRLPSRLYNDVPPKGFAAEFTTHLQFPLQSVVASVNSEEDFGVKLFAPNNANIYKIYGAFTAFEGVPAHGNGKALLTSPTNCAESAERAPLVSGSADTYQNPGAFSEKFSIAQPALTGCDKLQFTGKSAQNPSGQVGFTFEPTSTTGSTPVGATAHLHIDNAGLTDPKALATPELKRSVIKLPEGMSLNPSSANGLEGCSETQIGYLGKNFEMPSPIRFNEAQPACPDGSKLGTAEIETPLLENPLVGEVFLANQEENPFGSLLAIYLVVNDPLTGVLIKLPGEVRPDPVTGRLTTTFDDNPQLPFEDLFLHFRGGGPRSEFATSEVCGDFPTEGEWTPWSAPESGPPAQTTASFSVSSNCASSPG